MLGLANHKKGISAIVSVVLLIVIIVSAAGILLTYVKSTSQRAINLSPIDCVTVKSEIRIQEGKTCYNEITHDLEVTLVRKALDNSPIQRINFKLDFNNGNTESFTCGSCESCKILEPGQEKRYFLDSQVVPKTLKVSFDDCEIKTIEVVNC